MPSAAIHITDQRTAFSPHETVTGQVSWQLDVPPKSAELRLVWSTSGRGISDGSVVQAVPFAAPQPTESRPFTITLPDAPYSFSGSLISLTWVLELVIGSGDLVESVEIVVGPGGNAVSLPRVSLG